MSTPVDPSAGAAAVRSAPLLPVVLGTALVLVTYVTPIATVPATAADLGAGPGERAWILSSMSVGLAGALLASGVLGDALGRRRVLLVGLVATAVGAVGCALAGEPLLFIAARVLQGIGGAAVVACGLAVLAHRFPDPRERAGATAAWGASVALGIGAGGLLAAALDSLIAAGGGWRSDYWLTAVLALALVPVSLRRIEESRAATARRLDLAGLGLLAVALTLAVSALTQSRNGIGVATTVLAVLAVAALVGFVLVERGVAQPLLDPDLLRHPRFRAATGGSLTLGAGMIGMASFAPTLVQVGFGRGLWASTVPIVAWAGTSVLSALVVTRIPHPLTGPRPVALFLVLVAVGQATAYGTGAGSSVWRLGASLALAGIGTGVLNTLLGREAIASVPADRAAMGSGANNTARYLGAAIGITLFVTVATHTGADLFAGFDHAVVVTVVITLAGAALIALVRPEALAASASAGQ